MPNPTRLLQASIAFGFLAMIQPLTAVSQIEETGAPNIVIILADDAGLMDFGGYGGEANTPHINAIGDAGVRFTNYHTSPLCAPSRAMLLTGVDNHLTGLATIREVVTEEQRQQPGYSMSLQPGVISIADRLKTAGYDTFMTGKWHLGDGPGDLPNSHGFDRSFVLDASGADNWEQKSYMPYYSSAPWYQDGAPANLPEDFYSSEFIVDQMLNYLADRQDTDAPFLSFLSFQAIHIPVQAPAEFTARYDGVFDEGWDVMAERRWQEAKSRGLIHADAPMPTKPVGHVAWDTLTEDEKALMAKSMQVQAGMLEAMDHHVGRFVEHLRDSGEFENTIFVVTSDNGPEFNDPVNVRGMDLWMAMNGYNADIETLGEKGSLVAIGPHWASASASPGSYFKFYSSEGGTRVPLLISGPGITQSGLVDELSYVTDIAPTLIALADKNGATFTPTTEGTVPISGEDLSSILGGQSSDQSPSGPRQIGIEVSGNAAYYRGDYKLRKMTAPQGDGAWQLYDIRLDPGETLDLSSARPELKAEMLEAYQNYADQVGVLPLPADFSPLEQLRAAVNRKLLAQYGPYLLITGLAALALLIWLVWRLFFRRAQSS
ncbi:MAG: arylsulfatase [Pseudomonadota bacterium]